MGVSGINTPASLPSGGEPCNMFCAGSRAPVTAHLYSARLPFHLLLPSLLSSLCFQELPLKSSASTLSLSASQKIQPMTSSTNSQPSPPSYEPPAQLGKFLQRPAVNQSLCKGSWPQRSKRPLHSGKILGQIACHFRKPPSTAFPEFCNYSLFLCSF